MLGGMELALLLPDDQHACWRTIRVVPMALVAGPQHNRISHMKIAFIGTGGDIDIPFQDVCELVASREVRLIAAAISCESYDDRGKRVALNRFN